MVDKEKLIKALKCSIEIGAECDHDCPYCFAEEIDPEFPIKPDFEKDGKKYSYCCGFEDMTRDAIKYLEESL